MSSDRSAFPLEPTPASTQAHVLVVDNDQGVLELFTTLLSAEGYRVSTRAWADRDVAAIAELFPDLIILDYQWATEDEGWSLLQMLRMAPGTAHTPIVLCTGAVSHVEETRGHLHQMGVEVIYKPFEMDDLLDRVRRTLDGGRLSRARSAGWKG